MDFGLLFMTLVGSKLCMFILIGVNLQHVRRDIINDNAPRTILAAVKLHYHFRGGNQMIKSDKNLLERPYYLIYCKLLIFEVFEKNIQFTSTPLDGQPMRTRVESTNLIIRTKRTRFYSEKQQNETD